MPMNTKIKSLFENPRGILGRLAGLIMAHRRSNIERIDWTIYLLNVQPKDRILEIGYGPGVAIEKLARLVDAGRIVGIDHSATMLRQARKRNAKAISEGKVELLLGSVEDLPTSDAKYDKAFAINTLFFLADYSAVLRKLHGILKPGGLLAITNQPRLKGASDERAREIGERMRQAFAEAGFKDIRIEYREMKPVNSVCVMGWS
jgi:cyclopropane fatty-acyl-phospholipid synthase-like methyltransferase